MGGVLRLLPPRCGRRGSARLVPHPAGELASGKFFQGFNWVFDRATNAYERTVGWALRLSVIVLVVYVGLIGLTGFGFTHLPSGFIPSQDKGRLIINVQF